MALRITSYRPFVHCFPLLGPLREACDTIVDGMPATSTPLVFGLAGNPGVQVDLPFQLKERRPIPSSVRANHADC